MRIGTFTVTDSQWENQSELLRNKFWSRLHVVNWDGNKYWITAESRLFPKEVNPGELIPDYRVTFHRNRGRRDRVLVETLAPI